MALSLHVVSLDLVGVFAIYINGQSAHAALSDSVCFAWVATAREEACGYCLLVRALATVEDGVQEACSYSLSGTLYHISAF